MTQSNIGFQKNASSSKKRKVFPDNVGNDRRDKHNSLRERRLVRKLRLRQKGVA